MIIIWILTHAFQDSIYLLRKLYVEHMLLPFTAVKNRVTVVTSFYPRSPQDGSTLAAVRSISNAETPYSELCEYRLRSTRELLQQTLKGFPNTNSEIVKLGMAAITQTLQSTLNIIRAPMEGMESRTALDMILHTACRLEDMEEAVRKNRCENQKFDMEEMVSFLDRTKSSLLLIMEKPDPVPSWL